MEFLKKFSKKQLIIGAAVIVILLIVIIGTCVFLKVKGGTDTETVKNDFVTITGNIGNATKVTNEEIKEKSKEYKTVEEKIADDSLVAFSCMDITIYDKNDKKVQPDGDVKITMKMPETIKSGEDYEYNSSDDVYKVFRTEKDNSVTELKSEVSDDDNSITFTTSHFSVYTVAKFNKGKCELKTENIDDYVTALDTNMYVLNDTTVYDGPNTTWNPIGTLSKGQEVKVIGRYEENGWFKIQYSDTVVGYVSELDLSEEPVVEEQPQESETDNNASKDNSENTSSSSSKKNDSSQSSENNNTGYVEPTPQPDPEPTPQEPAREPNDCPAPTLTWTTYQGHYGFFATAQQKCEGAPELDMEVELSLKGTVQTMHLYFDDIGYVDFIYI